MVDLVGQYQHIKGEIDQAISGVLESAQFIKGPQVTEFEEKLANYLGVKHVIGCANGTDALQIALMALDLAPGDEILVPAFTYVATAEVIALLGLKPIMVDVDPDTFNVRVMDLESSVTDKTKAIVPVHLFGQCADMEPIRHFAKEYNLYVIEDNAQAIGADYTYSDGSQIKGGTMSHIGTTSFFPSKNLGCYGDGGAIFTDDDEMAQRLRMIANHGQNRKYHHAMIGCNSRLDTIQAAILGVKLPYLDTYAAARRRVADAYDNAFRNMAGLETPMRQSNSTHVFHQYTLKVLDGKRDELKEHLGKQGIPYGIYYPLPLYKQEAFRHYVEDDFYLSNTEDLCQSVLSLPIHTEMDDDTQSIIIESVKAFFA